MLCVFCLACSCALLPAAGDVVQVEAFSAKASLSLQRWCDFRAVAAVSRGEPLVMRGAFPNHALWPPSRLMQPPGMEHGSSPVVSMEFATGTQNFMPHSVATQSTAFLRWEDASRFLEGDLSTRSHTNFSFYMQQQAIYPEGHSDKELDMLVADMPRCLREISPLSSIIWLNGKSLVSSYLHFDGLDNIMVLLSGEKKFVLYPPWEIAKMSCGRKLTEFYFVDEEHESKHIGLEEKGMKFPSIPQWMKTCESFAHVASFEVTVVPGDILWIPRGWFHTVLSMPGTAALSFFFTNYSPLGDVPGALTMRSVAASDMFEQAIEPFRDAMFRQLQQDFPEIRFTDDEQGPHVTQLAVPVRRAFHRARKARADNLESLAPSWRWPSPSQWKKELTGDQFQHILDAFTSKAPADVATIQDFFGGPPVHQTKGRQWLRTVLQRTVPDGAALAHDALTERIFPGCGNDTGEFSCSRLLQKVSAAAGKLQTCDVAAHRDWAEL